jgi:hypothetical protein
MTIIKYVKNNQNNHHLMMIILVILGVLDDGYSGYFGRT